MSRQQSDRLWRTFVLLDVALILLFVIVLVRLGVLIWGAVR